MTGPEAATGRRRPVRVALDIADRVLRADTADACDDAGIMVADGNADVILIDRPVATALPAVALAADDQQRGWPLSVRAVVPPDIDVETLGAVITVVAAGYALMARPVAQDVDSDEADSGDEASVAIDGRGNTLSSREREVLTLLAEGASNKEIAIALGLSVSTVKFHVAAITGKLGARSRVEAVAIAVRAGLVMM